MVEKLMQLVLAVNDWKDELQRAVGGTSMFGWGHPDETYNANMFVRGWWGRPKAQRCVAFGCITCGYRTHVIYPWSDPSGYDVLMAVLEGLFGPVNSAAPPERPVGHLAAAR